METNPTDWHWERQPAAASLLAGWLDDARNRSPWLDGLAGRLRTESGNRLADLVDLWVREDTPAARAELEEVGYRPLDAPAGGELFHHPGGTFPRVELSAGGNPSVDVRVEDCVDFAAAQGLTGQVEGEPGRLLRRVTASTGGGLTVRAVERRGTLAAAPESLAGPSLGEQATVLAAFRTRPRISADERAAFEQTASLVEDAIGRVGTNVACALFFEAERGFWARRNRAARWQLDRQAGLGIGWANHDHHTYRSSRRHFHRLVNLFEKLGFHCRERFSPGLEAGWGAQVMEQPVCGIVTFNDVDLSPDELLSDFAHEPLDERTGPDGLGTIGLWCGLHGESILQAGMHHLECTFAFHELREQMAAGGISTMRAFSDFDHLKQAFTQGEAWPVDGARLDALLGAGQLTAAQAARFRRDGAIGSHLENLERNDGFKGFNQEGVTHVIHETDPRQPAIAGV